MSYLNKIPQVQTLQSHPRQKTRKNTFDSILQVERSTDITH